MALLYPDSIEHSAILLNLMKPDFKYDYVGVLHDSDILEDGSPAKPHYHFVFYLKDGKSKNAFSTLTGIPDRWLDPKDDRDDAIRYIFHFGYPDKYQYSTDDGIGVLQPLAEKLCCAKMSETQQVLMILKILDSLPRHATYRMFLEACCKADLYSAFRRMGVSASRLLDDKRAEWW